MALALPAQLGKVSLPLSGFRIRSRINSNKVWDEFLVFQGASYFRAVAKNLLYGLSARGLAINTAEPSGEEFPAFTHFWIERPGAHANAIDGESRRAGIDAHLQGRAAKPIEQQAAERLEAGSMRERRR